VRRTALLTVAVLAFVAATAGASAEPGVVNGYEPDDEFGFDGELTEEELDAVVSRAMARVEEIRGREFETRPSVERIERGGDGEGDGPLDANVTRNEYGDWNDIVWEALLVVGHDEYANEVIAETFGGATQGFYQPGNSSNTTGGGHRDGGSITVVGGVNEGTLAHELVHVLQDQHYNLSADRFSPPVQDEQLASDGVIEGEAEYIRKLYERRCAAEWECYTSGGGGGSGGSGGSNDGNVGILMTVYQPYSDGAEYVHRLRRRGGWEAVDEAYDDVPTTSREIIRHESFDAANVTYEDEARGNWTTFNGTLGRDGYDVAGEASVFVTFWYQSSRAGYGLDVTDTSGFFSPDGDFDVYSYRSDVSEGWAGDRIYPYRNEATNETGFVWRSVWETPEDAEGFASAYLAVLEGHGATEVDNATLRVEGDFRGAYRVARDGANVTIVRAPEVGALNEIRPSLADARSPVEEPIDARPGEPTPGFTVVAALVAVTAVALLVRS
jgi:PGF-CTERM protein